MRAHPVPGNVTAGIHHLAYALHQDLHPGDTVLLDDGLISMTVTAIEDGDIVCRVENPGVVSVTIKISMYRARRSISRF